MDRGVIASPGIFTSLENGFHFHRSLSREELRYYILYWDRVVIPANSFFYIGLDEEDDLVRCGAIERPEIRLTGTFGGQELTHYILNSQSIVATKLIRDRNVDWVLHHIGSDAPPMPGESVSGASAKIELINLLPVPIGEIPLADILEFKERRHDELEQVHSTLDELYEEIVRHQDPSLKEKEVFDRLRSSIKALDRVSTERFKSLKRFDLSAEINLSGERIATGAAAGMTLNQMAFDLDISLGAVAGAALSILKISAKASNIFSPASHKLKLTYIANAAKEEIIDSKGLR